MKNVAYPFAYNEKGIPVSIDDAKHDATYFCPGCKKPMILKPNDKMTYHFAHKTDDLCRPDVALFETAKISITKEFNGFVKSRGDFVIDVPCSECRRAMRYNLTAHGIAIGERPPVSKDVCSGLAILRNDSSMDCIIAVATSHDFASNGNAASKIPVIQIKPSWQQLLYVQKTLNMPCRKCRIRKIDLKHFMMPVFLKNQSRIQELNHDQFGKPLFSKIKNRLNTYAHMLHDVGFAQSSQRATLFIYDNPYWDLYADLDSTGLMPIWEDDCEVALYASPKNGRKERYCRPDCCECVLDVMQKVLSEKGVATRRSDLKNHWHKSNHI